MLKDNPPPCILDVEASGFGSNSYPIEVGVALSSGERLSLLIRPEPQWTHWDPGAELVHGLTRELLMRSGKPIAEVANDFNDLLDGTTAYSDGWVVDKPWLNTLFHTARIAQRFSLSPIEQIMNEAQFEVWDSTKQAVIQELQMTRHRASSDAWIIQKTFERTLEQTAVSNTSGRINQHDEEDLYTTRKAS